MIAEVLGHSVNSMTMGRYGKRFRPDVVLKGAILKLDYGIDLEHLKGSKCVVRSRHCLF